MKILIENNNSEEIIKIRKYFDLSEKQTPLGYFYLGGEHVFILPKVYESSDEARLKEHALKFYSALLRYRNEAKDSRDFKESAVTGGTKDSCPCSRLNSALRILDFYRRNSRWVITVISQSKNGGRTDWRRTITKTRPTIINGNTIYHKLLSKKRIIDFDEQLIVIFYSILNYLKHQGFPITTELNFDIIPVNRFKAQYIDKRLGIKALKNIKYKYFDNTSLELWQLSYDFFACNTSADKNAKPQFLVAHSFHTVFEAMVDSVVSDEGLKEHRLADSDENRRLDHVWVYDDPIIKGHKCIYVADSKYYRTPEELEKDKTAIHKQFVYPRNVIDNIMFDDLREYKPMVYDDKSHGYHIMGNCLIRSAYDKDDTREFWEFEHPIIPDFKFHHRDRLFDRNTMFLIGIEINLKRLIELYASKSTADLGLRLKEKIMELLKNRITGIYNVEHRVQSSPTITHEEVGRYINVDGTWWEAQLKSSK